MTLNDCELLLLNKISKNIKYVKLQQQKQQISYQLVVVLKALSSYVSKFSVQLYTHVLAVTRVILCITCNKWTHINF